MTHRAAPVQMSYLGYPTTTGLAAVDYRISDAIVDPEGVDAGTERVLRLPGGMFRYAPPLAVDEPSVGPLYASGRPTFGCFCNLSKVTASTIALWASVLSKVPQASMIVKAGALRDSVAREQLLAGFELNGVSRDRVELLGWTDHANHLAAYSRIDVMLDTVPFNLAANTCEALWMGVPVVTLRSDRAAGRMGASLLRCAGLDEWVAADAAAYVRIAAGLVADASQLAQLRAGLRDRLRESELLNGKSLADEFSALVHQAFERWLEVAPLPAAARCSVLHVGCGSPEAGKLPAHFSRGHWREVRVDIDETVAPDFVASMTDMSVVPSACVNAVYSSHNVEHLLPNEVPRALAEFLRVLEPGGFALVTVPDLKAAAERVVRDIHEQPMYHSPAGPINALDMIYGYAEFVEGGNHFMVHKTGFTCRTLARALEQAGFERVVVRSSGFALWAVGFKPLAKALPS